MRTVVGALLGASLVAGLSGCGAAYYGAAIGIFASQKDDKITDVSFPDGVPTNDTTPAFATVALSPSVVSLDRNLATFDPSGASVGSQTAVTLVDNEILRVDFPPGYGEALSNRDAGTTLTQNDRIIIRIDGDTSQAITMGAADTASVGTRVAEIIQTKVRALTPIVTTVPATSYSNFTASFDDSTGAYRFRSGTPGEASAVVLDPEPVFGSADQTPDAASAATATRLGLGVGRGGIETTGLESIGCVVLNRGTDVLPQGTNIELYLSHDKTLDTRVDLPIDVIPLDQSVAVGEARRFTRKVKGPPLVRLLRRDLTPGNYYVLFNLAPSGEQVTSNNVLVSSRPVEVHLPVDDPATATVETAAPLDVVITLTSSPVGVVTGEPYTSVLTLTNFGAAVPPTGVLVDLDGCLAATPVYEEPASFLDPAGLLTGVRINPTDPSRPITVRIVQDGGIGTIVASLSGSTITAAFNPGAGVTVQQLVTALNGVTSASTQVVDAFLEGSTPTASLAALIMAAGKSEVTARTIFAGARVLTFPQGEPLRTVTTSLEAPIRATSFRAGLLPIKLFSAYRARTRLPTNDQNPRTDLRVGANFVRVYARSTAFFDSTTGATLPTRNADDFAALDAVTLRPVNTGSIRQGQQRVFRFEIPDTAATNDESQLLVILRTTNFDAHLDLLSAAGRFITGVDDSGLGSFPVLYTPVQASAGSRSFYLVVSPQRVDESDLIGGGETFELTISVNPRQLSDPGLVAASNAGNVVGNVEQRFEDASVPRTRNDVLVPFSMANGKAEVQFLLPQRARVRFTTRPTFEVGVRTVITRFVQNQVPSPVDHQAELDETGDGIVYRPPGGTIDTSHILEAGAYTFAIESTGGLDDQPLRLEIDTEFIPPD